MRTVFVNGAYLSEDQARISIFDRGFLMADGVYEVTTVIGGKMLDFEKHMDRLELSLAAIECPCPLDRGALREMHRKLMRDNALDEGLIYLQVTRGPQDRDFLFPEKPQPTVVAFTQAKKVVENPAAERGIKVGIAEEVRWRRREVKTIQLFAASQAKTEAVRAGLDDAWFVEDGYVTEGTSNNAFIVTREHAIVTRQLDRALLPGITRAAVREFAGAHGYHLEERPFTVDEARNAEEAFVTSATALVLPVVEIDGATIGNGRPGPIAVALRALYIGKVTRSD